MKSMRKLTIKNLLLNKTRTLVTMVGILLSAALITLAACMALSIQQTAVNLVAQRSGNYTASLYGKLTNTDFEKYQKDSGVQNAFGVSYIGVAKNEYPKYESVPYISIIGISDGAFEECTNLMGIDLPGSLTDMGDYTFMNCTSLTSIGLSESLVSIGSSAFDNCTSLNSIVLPDSVTTIFRYAFAECDSLRSIHIPLSVVIIDYTAFEDTDLKDIYYAGTQVQWNAIKGIEDLNDYGDLNVTIHYVDYDYEKLNDFVSRLYRNFLKREPDEVREPIDPETSTINRVLPGSLGRFL